MGQRSQIYIRYDEKLIVANYYQWNYGDLMISRARGVIEYIKHYLDCEYYFIFKDKSYLKKISRICDVNFDYRDIAISCDIVQEWKEQFSGEDFNDIVFRQQDNNDGQLFIDITKDGKIKYAFSENPDYEQIMTAEKYLEWDYGKEWETSLSQEIVDTCKANVKYIQETAELMTAEELNQFVNAKYEI